MWRKTVRMAPGFAPGAIDSLGWIQTQSAGQMAAARKCFRKTAICTLPTLSMPWVICQSSQPPGRWAEQHNARRHARWRSIPTSMWR